MTHPLVLQLRFTRSEFMRGLQRLTDPDARQRCLPMNCISWNVGHLAWHEQHYFLFYAQQQLVLPEIDRTFAYGAPASTPPLAEVMQAWQTITQAADPWLDEITTETLQGHVVRNGKVTRYIFGSLLQRVIYHYWYHNGENQAIRQSLGHTGLPEFVGDIDDLAPYRPEG
jgi:hypothetical protein